MGASVLKSACRNKGNKPELNMIEPEPGMAGQNLILYFSPPIGKGTISWAIHSGRRYGILQNRPRLWPRGFSDVHHDPLERGPGRW